jgi:hypothetical protein
MRACCHEDSRIDISWFVRTGPEFVDASQRSYNASSRSVHQMGRSVVRIRRGRALAETGCPILMLRTIGGVEAIFTSHNRMHIRLQRRDRAWKIFGLCIVYVSDQIAPNDPSARLEINRAELV